MKAKTTILFFLRKSRMNKIGEAPIYLRITVNGKRIDLATSRFIDPAKWNVKAGAMKGNSEDARTLNTYLATINNKVLKHINNLEIQDVKITADALKSLVTGKTEPSRTLLEVFRYHNDRMKSLVGIDYAIASYKRYIYTVAKLQTFLKQQYRKDDILLTDIKYSFVTNFEYYLKTTEKVEHNTAMKHIKNLKKVVRMALDNEWLDRDPFARYRCIIKDVNRDYLTPHELQAIINKEFTIARLSQVRDIFIFSCYTGLAYCDVAKLTPENISVGIDGEKWLTVFRQKTDTRSSLPLLPHALEIIEKYKDDPVANSSGKLLPVISNQKMNAYLKDIATLCGISKTLTFHMARHSFATTVTLSNGVPIETVSRMLGHTNIKTTQIYSKVVDSKVSHDMQNLRNILNPKPAKTSMAM